MCDTMVALPSASKSGAVLFAKNSDRGANEAQYVHSVPAADHPAGANVACTYITIPQVARTHAVLLSRPFWMWGAEMGANEHGLVIGNEAVFAKLAPSRKPALLGMDLVRLGLERAETARGALDVITGLLETHGQGGNCAHIGRFEYHNSFLIADAGGDAWVLETVGRHWVAEKVRDRRAISNCYTIGADFDLISDGMIDLALDHGWTKDRKSFDAADAFTDRFRSRLATGPARFCRASDLLKAKQAGLTRADMMAILRDHGSRGARDRDWHPDGPLGGTICAHGSWGPVRRHGQTTGSLVSELTPGQAVHWITGTSAPDTGIFKPVCFAGASDELAEQGPDFGPEPTDRYDPDTLWWRHERLHRAVLANYPARIAAFGAERDRLEQKFQTRIDQALAEGAGGHALAPLTALCWTQAKKAEDEWLKSVDRTPAKPSRAARPSVFYTAHWQRLNRLAAFPAR